MQELPDGTHVDVKVKYRHDGLRRIAWPQVSICDGDNVHVRTGKFVDGKKKVRFRWRNHDYTVDV